MTHVGSESTSFHGKAKGLIIALKQAAFPAGLAP